MSCRTTSIARICLVALTRSARCGLLDVRLCVSLDGTARRRKLRCAAATCIQSHWRGCLGRRRVAYIRLRHSCVVRLQAWRRQTAWERRLSRFWNAVYGMLSHTRSARGIQGWWWRLKPGRLLRSLKVRRCADCVGTCLTGSTPLTNSLRCVARAQWRRYLRDKNILEARAKLEKESATKIQSLWRGVLGRRLFKQHYCAREIQVRQRRGWWASAMLHLTFPLLQLIFPPLHFSVSRLHLTFHTLHTRTLHPRVLLP